MAAKPLMQPDLWSEPPLAHSFKHIRAMKERGLGVAFNANDLLLREDTARFFCETKVDPRLDSCRHLGDFEKGAPPRQAAEPAGQPARIAQPDQMGDSG
ncbi:MAG TPA: hypothetical protein VEI03_24385 [Stellaceae bacterium]|nr:hypothetical protein [Stellaceae bacterium]